VVDASAQGGDVRHAVAGGMRRRAGGERAFDSPCGGLASSKALMPRLGRASVALAAFVLLRAVAAASGESADALATQSLEECEAGRASKAHDARKGHFERGQALAERAVALDDRNAEAHFALFCNLGELMRVDGESISSVFALRRLMSELDRTLALDPDHTDALAAKGTLLVRLPRLFGGDVRKGEELLRLVIEKDPMAVSSRLTLAQTCGARGDRDQAIGFASRALQIARAQGRADKVAEAQAMLAELGAGR
jgi:tetratricopeptide (TPR) repeat protein